VVVVNESGYIVGDPFPDLRGLMHIKDDLEQRPFAETNKNMLLVLWSTAYPHLEAFLDAIDTLAHQKVVS
jgi:hypothetical protein